MHIYTPPTTHVHNSRETRSIDSEIATLEPNSLETCVSTNNTYLLADKGMGSITNNSVHIARLFHLMHKLRTDEAKKQKVASSVPCSLMGILVNQNVRQTRCFCDTGAAQLGDPINIYNGATEVKHDVLRSSYLLLARLACRRNES